MEHNAKRSTKQKQRFYFLLCFAPLISFAIFKDEWLARAVAVVGFIGACNALIFWYAFDPKTNFIWHRSKWARQSLKTQLFGQRLFRILTIFFGCLIFWFVTLPVATDCLQLMRYGEKCLIHLQGQITSDESPIGAYFFRQNIWISENGRPTGLAYEAFFFPRHIGQNGRLQQFLIMPKSKLILACVPVTYPQIQP